MTEGRRARTGFVDRPPMPTMEAVIDAESDLSARGRYTLVHLMVPHVPYLLDEGCQRQAVTGPEAQSRCAMRLVTDLLDELERLDRFDEPLIVVHGDHGAGVTTNSSGLSELPDDRDSLEWNRARSRSLLLVKPAGVSRTQPFQVSDYPSRVADVMPTIFDTAGLPYEGPSDRLSLLGNPERRSKRYFHFYPASVFGVPEGPITRYVVAEDDFALDEVIDYPG